MEFGVCKLINDYVMLIIFDLAMGSIIGLLISSFLSYQIGYVGPFSFTGILFLFFGIFQNKLINFVSKETEIKVIEELNIKA